MPPAAVHEKACEPAGEPGRYGQRASPTADEPATTPLSLTAVASLDGCSLGNAPRSTIPSLDVHEKACGSPLPPVPEYPTTWPLSLTACASPPVRPGSAPRLTIPPSVVQEKA